jgi:cation diffusion facilitator CzcD-associated flavoprotein CzcO
MTAPTGLPVAIVGAGFSGICLGIKLRRAGIPFVILERAGAVGGVWRDNTYPGAACDVPSHLYSYSFEPSPDWSRRYGTQPEIRAYLDQCARKYHVMEHIRFHSEVLGAQFDADAGQWRIELVGGEHVDAQFLITGTGQLSLPAEPQFPGLDTFEGTAFHSARWRDDVDLRGRTVAVVGSGASAIQFVPRIAPLVDRLYLLQRSAPYVLPKRDRTYRPVEKYLYRHFPALLMTGRARQYVFNETRVLPLTKGIGAPALRAFWKRYMHSVIPDPSLREQVTPDYAMGCKRVLISNDWYPTLTRDNVEVITAGLREVTPTGVVATDGTQRDVDTIIFGTGFVTTDFLAPMTITGRNGHVLHDIWKDRGGAEAFKGVAMPGFPNLFMMYGPNTNLGHNSIVYMLERQADYVIDAIRYTQRHGAGWIEVRDTVHDEFNADLQRRLSKTVWQSGCDSWYVTEAGKNTNNWPSFTFDYRKLVQYFDPLHYRTDAETAISH